MHKLVCQTICLLGTLLIGLPADAARINADEVAVVSGSSGMEIVKTNESATEVFKFSPFRAHKKRAVPGFSDPIGTGVDPQLKVFSGVVNNMHLLGDFHPVNPHNPQEVAPTAASVQTANIINTFLYRVGIPGEQKLIAPQLDLKASQHAKFSPQLRTTETTPLVLEGFGSVSEFPIPMQVHLTDCPNFATKHYLLKSDKKGDNSNKKRRNARDCFVI